MAKIENVHAVRRALDKLMRIARREDGAAVIVGYTANYAVHVHENDRKYRVGEFKFLEKPARLLQRELARIIRTVRKQTGSLKDGLLLAGMRLQRESQKLVPVDTGNLKGSAFTRLE